VKPGFVGAQQDAPMKFVCRSTPFAFSNFYLTFNRHQSWLVGELCTTGLTMRSQAFRTRSPSALRGPVSVLLRALRVFSNRAAFSDILDEIIDQHCLFLLRDSSVAMNLEIVDFN
jgi:hypothetical protein